MIKKVPIIDVNSGRIIREIEGRKNKEYMRKKELQEYYQHIKETMTFRDKRVKSDEYKIFAEVISQEFPIEGLIPDTTYQSLYRINRSPKTRVTIKFLVSPKKEDDIRMRAEAFFGEHRIIDVDSIKGCYSTRTYGSVTVRISKR